MPKYLFSSATKFGKKVDGIGGVGGLGMFLKREAGQDFPCNL